AGPDGERNPSLDHGVMVPLYFINKYYTNYKLVRIGLSGLSLEAHYHFGELIANAVQALGRSCVFVGSGDLSHCQKQDGPYGYKPEGPAYDEKLMDTMNRGAFKELLTFDEALLDKAEECGHRSFTIMGGAVGENKVDITTLSHESTFGVGYGFAIYHPTESTMNKTDSNDIYVNLARMTIAEYITDHKRIKVPDDLPDELTKARAGAFVSIHEHGMLRGCIGTIAPVRDSLAEEIIFNAISASTEDPRFSPIKKEELPFLEINVDVLGDAEDISSPDELDVKKYGVIVTNGYRRGLLLPDLDGVDTVEEQISIARQKAGIGPSESVQLQRFEVIRHK
ncbi:MAG: AmmeMemoRadiSam system protein A, partial [Lachnospiraceae bacterium]|nr:AmmeMemoRadiSam system protein A [Lachnospiraceae bacterium]